MITRIMAALSCAACLAWKCATELVVLGGSSGRYVFSVQCTMHNMCVDQYNDRNRVAAERVTTCPFGAQRKNDHKRMQTCGEIIMATARCASSSRSCPSAVTSAACSSADARRNVVSPHVFGSRGHDATGS